MAEIAPDELSVRLRNDDEDLVVLDIRHGDEYEDWHVPGSTNIDVYDELKDDPDEAAEKLRTLPQGREIVTVCGVGVVSDIATETLRDEGYEARTLLDGMKGWSRVHRTAPVDAGLDGTLVQVARPGTGCLSYVLVSAGEAAVFDPSSYLDEYEAVLAEYDADLVGVFDTHAHADHVSGGRKLADRHGVRYRLHPADPLELEAPPLEDEQVIEVGHVDIEVIHTPGHTPGSVCFGLDDKALLTGDTLFHQSVGRVELGVEAGIEDSGVEDNAATLYESLQRLLERPDNRVVLPAHDPGSPDPPVTATLGEVKEVNEDLQRDREEFIQTLAGEVPEQPPNFQRIKRVNVGAEAVSEGELADLELGPNRCAAE